MLTVGLCVLVLWGTALLARAWPAAGWTGFDVLLRKVATPVAIGAGCSAFAFAGCFVLLWIGDLVAPPQRMAVLRARISHVPTGVWLTLFAGFGVFFALQAELTRRLAPRGWREENIRFVAGSIVLALFFLGACGVGWLRDHHLVG